MTEGETWISVKRLRAMSDVELEEARRTWALRGVNAGRVYREQRKRFAARNGR